MAATNPVHERLAAEAARLRLSGAYGLARSMLHEGKRSYFFFSTVEASGTVEAQPIRAAPVDDTYAQGGRILANNKMTFDLLLTRVKTPDASRYPWDYLNAVARIPAGEAFRPVAESGCALAT